MNELSILERNLQPTEVTYLRFLGWRGTLPRQLQRLFLALREESEGRLFGPVEQELFTFFLKNPEEATWLLSDIPKRTQPYVLKLAAFDHYIQLNGYMKASTYYAGPRVRAS